MRTFGRPTSAKHPFALVSPQCFRTAAVRRHRRHAASRQPSNRYGLEWANYYTPLEHVAFDFDSRTPEPFLPTIDGDDAAPGSPGGKRVPEAVGLVISSGITLHDLQALFGEFAPAHLWSARFDVRRNLSLKCNGFAQCGASVIRSTRNGGCRPNS